MVDGTWVKLLAFQNLDKATEMQRVPGPVLRVMEGTQVTINIWNARPEPHRVEITGVPAATIEIGPNSNASVCFTAPTAGTYMYHDAYGGSSFYRILGLHGAFIVHPYFELDASQSIVRDDGATATSTYALDPGYVLPGGLTQLTGGSRTPYNRANHTKQLRCVFDYIGVGTEQTGTRFPGSKWQPCSLDQEYSKFEKIWLCTQIDPRENNRIRATSLASAIPTEQALINRWLPRYFTINGRSGFDISHLPNADDVVPFNNIGEPTLLRVMNAGLSHHSMHIHGNHPFELSHANLSPKNASPICGPSGALPLPVPGQIDRTASDYDPCLPEGAIVVHKCIYERDIWPNWPMDRRDLVLPYEMPPDIPDQRKYQPGGTPGEPFPLRYVMHDHTEMATTAGGGNYPQGLVTHWDIRGPRRTGEGVAPVQGA